MDRLIKPHMTINYDNGAMDRAEYYRDLMHRLGTVTTWPTHMVKNDGKWNPTIFMWAREVEVKDLCIYIKHPLLTHPPDELQEGLAELEEQLQQTRDLAGHYGLNCSYAIVEYEGVNAVHNPYMDDLHQQTFDLIYPEYCDHLVVYSRGSLMVNNSSWDPRPLYSLNESAPYLSCDCYWTGMWDIREQINRMAELAYDRGKGEKIVPWTCFGRGYSPKLPPVGHGNEDRKFTIGVTANEDWWYVGRWFNWENTVWVDEHGVPLFQREFKSGMETARVYAGDIPFVIVWPGPWDYREPTNTCWQSDWENYYAGAHGLLP